jgi:nitrogen fixation NifU-like protein
MNDNNLDEFTDKLQQDIIEEIKKTYSKKVIEHWVYPRNLSGMETPDGFAEYRGLCGDTMKIYLKVKDNKISEATFLTDGCGPTIACGSMVTELAKGKDIQEAWQITRESILEALDGLPEEHEHCAALAATTLHMALINYEKIQQEPWKKNYPKSE